MPNRIKILAALFVLTLMCGQAGAMTLARHGRTDYRIVISAQAIPAEVTAAKELADNLKQVTGADFPVLTEAEAGTNSPVILVGQMDRLKVDWKSLGHDGIVIKTDGANLVLAGGRPRGTLYAVYTFLEDTAGCRWWTGTENFIPRRKTLKIPKLDMTYTPKLLYREAYYQDLLENPKFAVKLKLNGSNYRISDEFGSHYDVLGWCHTSYQLLPPSQYFAAHPDWYAEISGKRSADGSQLCLSNDEMRKELTRVALTWIAKNPTAGIISISQNDCLGECQCPKCQAIEKEEGSPSGPWIRFVNAVAEDIEKKYPDMLVETLAYQFTRKPPLHVHPRENVLVRLCSIEGDFSKPLDSDGNKTFRDDLNQWRAIAPHLYVWNYVTDFANYIQPQPNLAALGPDLRFFVNNNVVGVFEQGDAYCSVGDFVRLRAWVLGHLEWDPSRDENQLIAEFLKGYYGAAAPYLQSYLDLLHDSAAKKGTVVSCGNSDLSFLTLPVMTQATHFWDTAEKAVAGKPELAARVRRERLSFDLAWLLRYTELKKEYVKMNIPFTGPKDAHAACEEFIRNAEKWKAGNISEGASFDSYIPQLEALFPAPAAK